MWPNGDRLVLQHFLLQCQLNEEERGILSDFIWDFGKLPFPTHLGKYFIKIGKMTAKIHEIGKIKAIFGLGMTPIYGLKNGQIKSLILYNRLREQLGIHSPNVYTLLGYDGQRKISTWREQIMHEVGQYIERKERFKVAQAQNFASQ